MSDEKAAGFDAEERKRRADRIKKETSVGFFASIAQVLFSPPETAEERTKRQLSTARSIAGKEASAETVATIAQTLATNEQTAIAQARKR